MQDRRNRRLDGAEPTGQQREAGDQDPRDVGEQHDVGIQVDAGGGQRQAQTRGVGDPGAGSECDQHSAVAGASDNRLGLRVKRIRAPRRRLGWRHGLPAAQPRKRPRRPPGGRRPSGHAGSRSEHQQHGDRADPPQPDLPHPRMLAGDSHQERQRPDPKQRPNVGPDRDAEHENAPAAATSRRVAAQPTPTPPRAREPPEARSQGRTAADPFAPP